MVKIYFDFLIHKQREALDAVVNFTSVLALEDHQKKLSTAQDAISKLAVLDEHLPPLHRPPWLSQLGATLKKYYQSSESTASSIAIVKSLPALMAKLEAHDWKDVSDEDPPVQISKVATEAYLKSDFPKLFDNLADELEKVIAVDAITSTKAIVRLKDLIKLIRKNARSTWYSAQYLVPFAFSTIKHTIKAYAKEWSGPMGEGLKNAIEEMVEEWPTTQEAVNNAVHEALESSFSDVPYLPGTCEVDALDVTQVFKLEPPRLEDKRHEQTEKPQT